VRRVQPRLIEGGGTGDERLEGQLHVHVIDARTGVALEGTVVEITGPSDLVEITGPSDLVATTDGQGLATFEHGSLRENVTVEVRSEGRVPLSWFGLGSANLTVPLTDDRMSLIEGRVAGFAELTPAEGRYLAAVVTTTLPFGVESIDQVGTTTLRDRDSSAVCVRSAGDASPCQFSVAARPGLRAAIAVVAEGNPRGTPDDPSDDTFEVLGFASARGIDVPSDGGLQGVELSMLEGATVDIELGLPSPPEGAEDVIGVPGINLGDEGVLVVPVVARQTEPRTVLPSETAVDGTRWVVQKALVPSSAWSAGIVRDPEDLSMPVPAAPFPERPVLTPRGGGELELVFGASAAFHRVELRDDTTGELRWLAYASEATLVTPPESASDGAASLTPFSWIAEVAGDLRLEDVRSSPDGAARGDTVSLP
jgi:hypothetical protein